MHTHTTQDYDDGNGDCADGRNVTIPHMFHAWVCTCHDEIRESNSNAITRIHITKAMSQGNTGYLSDK